jgi:hypothetical protein
VFDHRRPDPPLNRRQQVALNDLARRMTAPSIVERIEPYEGKVRCRCHHCGTGLVVAVDEVLAAVEAYRRTGRRQAIRTTGANSR